MVKIIVISSSLTYCAYNEATIIIQSATQQMQQINH